MIDESHKRQYREEGYFLLPDAIPKASVDTLRAVCDHYVTEFNESKPLGDGADTPCGGPGRAVELGVAGSHVDPVRLGIAQLLLGLVGGQDPVGHARAGDSRRRTGQ